MRLDSFPCTQRPRISEIINCGGASDCGRAVRSILHFPGEILTTIAVHLVINRSSQQHRVLKTNPLGKLLTVETRKQCLIDFKELLNLGLTCKYLHSICQRIYQKQVVLTLPSTRHTLSQIRWETRRDKWGQPSRTSFHPYKRTIETNESVAKDWSGAQNVNWLFISNQTGYRKKHSVMFPDLISSTVRIARSFSNLKFLCLSRLHSETIMSCLERGVGKNLQALSITLPDVDDSESSLRSLARRMAALTTIFHLEAIQINDIEPTWVGLLNRVNHLKEISLNITNSTPTMFRHLSRQKNVLQLEIFGGFREASIGPSFFHLIHKTFPQVEVFKCGLHFAGSPILDGGEISQYAAALARFHDLRQFVFNHHNLAHMLDYSGEASGSAAVLDRFYAYSSPYFQTSPSLRELISIDFSDRQSVGGIIAQRVDLNPDMLANPPNHSCASPSHHKIVLGEVPIEPRSPHRLASHDVIPDSDVSPKMSFIKMSKIEDVREKIMVSFEHRWTKID